MEKAEEEEAEGIGVPRVSGRIGHYLLGQSPVTGWQVPLNSNQREEEEEAHSSAAFNPCPLKVGNAHTTR